MHTPTKAQMQVVIDNLKKVLPIATLPNHLDMGCPHVNNTSHTCGTVHCFGGWYAVAVCDLSEFINYEEGKDQLATDLGFLSDCQYNVENLLVDWAMYNPGVWGNNNGTDMFLHERAFQHITKRPNGALNLQHIIDHLEQVRDRLPL